MFTQTDVDTYSFVRGTDLKKRDTLWATIYLNTSSGTVHVVQRWNYDFKVANGFSDWTDDEKVNFHYALRSAVTGTWDSQTPVGPSSDPTIQQFLNSIKKQGNVRIGVTGATPFAKKFAGTGLDIDFDVILVAAQAHWKVTLTKDAVIDPSKSFVDWGARKIQLHSLNNSPNGACQAGAHPACVNNGFVTSRHEFGHTLLADDEYTTTSPSRADIASVMNIGTQVRPRHYAFIVSQLNVMAPGSTFRAVNA